MTATLAVPLTAILSFRYQAVQRSVARRHGHRTLPSQGHGLWGGHRPQFRSGSDRRNWHVPVDESGSHPARRLFANGRRVLVRDLGVAIVDAGRTLCRQESNRSSNRRIDAFGPTTVAAGDARVGDEPVAQILVRQAPPTAIVRGDIGNAHRHRGGIK